MNEKVMEILRKPWVIPAVTGGVSFAVGVGLGYILGKRNGDVFEVVLDEDVHPQMSLDFTDKPVESFSFDHPKIEMVSMVPESDGTTFVVQIDEDHEIGQVMNPRMDPSEIEVAEEPALVNVFAESQDDWDYEAEMSTRGSDQPYIIHREEYENNEMGYSQSTLTYYEGDEILVDELETPIFNHAEIVGELKFGHGSEDANLVYIRNERFRAEYEVIRDRGLYQVEVLGADIADAMERADIKHSRHVIHKFRED